jgi:NhaP-type Na+/H+ and K+/H+ antiporter
VQQAVALILIGLTILAFWKRETTLFMVNVIAWLFATFYFVNETWSASNEYLKYAIAGLCLAMTVVMVAKALQVYFEGRPRVPTSSDIQAAHRKRVAGITNRRRKWWEE